MVSIWEKCLSVLGLSMAVDLKLRVTMLDQITRWPGNYTQYIEASPTEWPALRHHIPCTVHIIQLALGAFINSFGVKGGTKSWEAHERDQYFEENESTDIGKSQRLRKEGNVRIYTVSAMKPGSVKIIEKVCIGRIFESTKTDHCIAANAYTIDYTDTRSSKRVDWLSKNQSMHRRSTYYGCKNTVEFDTRVAWASLPIMRIHHWVAQEPQIHWILATIQNTSWIDHCEVRDGSPKAVPILDLVDVEKVYSSSASYHECVQWHVRSYGWRYASFR